MKLQPYLRLMAATMIFCLPTSWAVSAPVPLQTWPQRQAASINPTRTVQIVNIWATWCAPCRKEMPMLSQWAQQKQQQEGRNAPEVIGVAMDTEVNLQRFTQQVKVSYPLLRYTGQDSRAWMQGMGNQIGGLPFTLVRAPRCGFSQTLLGSLDTNKLNQAVAAARQACQHKGIK